MRTSPGKRNFETLILALGILIAVVAAINASALSIEKENSTGLLNAMVKSDGKSAKAGTVMKDQEKSCQDLKILTIN